MRDDVHIAEVRAEDGDATRWRQTAVALEQRVRELQEEVELLTRHRHHDRMMRDSWQEQCLRDAGMRAIAERRAAVAQRLLDRAGELLTAWAACHDDPGLARRTDRLLEEADELDDLAL